MVYTLCWYEPAQNLSYEMPYGTLAEAQLHFDYLVSTGIEPYLKCEVLN